MKRQAFLFAFLLFCRPVFAESVMPNTDRQLSLFGVFGGNYGAAITNINASNPLVQDPMWRGAFTGGGLFAARFKRIGFQTGFLIEPRQIQLVVSPSTGQYGTESVTFTEYLLPLEFTVWPLPFFFVGAGGYLGEIIGSVSCGVTGAATCSAATSRPNELGWIPDEIGLAASTGVAIKIGKFFAVYGSVRYDLGLTNFVLDNSKFNFQSLRFADVQGLIGIGFSWYPNAAVPESKPEPATDSPEKK